MPVERWYPKGQTRPAISSSPWDILVLNGTYLAGRARVVRASAAWKRDAKKRPGSSADRPTVVGFDARPIVFELTFATTDEADITLDALRPYIPAPGASSEPARISHPAIDHLDGVKHMQITEVGELRLSRGLLTLQVAGEAWVAAAKQPKRDRTGERRVTKTETKPAPANVRRQDAERRGLLGSGNPDPATQSGFCSPNFTPGA